ncbi:MAG: OsmC family protein [Myxococcota bacterium]
MLIFLEDDTSITLSQFDEPDFQIEAASEDVHFSAIPMFATSLGLCTFSVVAEYGRRFDADASSVEVDVDWSYREDPFRIGEIAMTIRWPDLPEERLQAVERAASHCTIHNTLEHPPNMQTTVTRSNERDG